MSNKYVSQAVYQTLQTTKMNNQKTVRLTTIRLNLLQVCPSNPFFFYLLCCLYLFVMSWGGFFMLHSGWWRFPLFEFFINFGNSSFYAGVKPAMEWHPFPGWVSGISLMGRLARMQTSPFTWNKPILWDLQICFIIFVVFFFLNLKIRFKFALNLGFRPVMGVSASHRYVPKATPCVSFPFFPLKTLKVITFNSILNAPLRQWWDDTSSRTDVYLSYFLSSINTLRTRIKVRVKYK